MDCGHHQPQPENVERGMHHNDRRSVSGCQENRAKPASWGWSCRERDAARDENGRSGFNRPRKSGTVRSNPGSSGECRIIGNDMRTNLQRAILGSLLGATFLAGVPAEAAVVVSTKPTAHMSCTSGVCTATAANAVLNVTDLENLLAA